MIFLNLKLRSSEIMAQPHVVMIAGPNGAGKTSAAMTLLPDYLNIREFVNADEIARGLSPLNQNAVVAAAGRIMKERIDHLVESRQNFAFETTAAGTTRRLTMRKCREAGYATSIVFLYLSSPALAIERVKLRVSQGGHDIPKQQIIDRFYRGIKNLFTIYVPLAGVVEIYDNSLAEPSLIAKKLSLAPDWVVHDSEIWQRIQENNHEK
jgi:predicted ABC-type ATPase